MISTILSAAGPVRVADQGAYPLYSTGDWQRGSSDAFLRLFSYTIGDQVARSAATVQTSPRTASERDTNVETKMQMAAQEGMLITSIRLKLMELQCIVGTNDPTETFQGMEPGVLPFNLDYADLNLVLKLVISGKIYEQHPLQWFAAGYGTYVTLAGTAGTVTSYGQNGFPSHDAARYVPQPHIVLPDEEYFVDIANPRSIPMVWAFPSGSPDGAQTQIRFRVTLDGSRVRDVGAEASQDPPYAVYERPVLSPYNVQAG